MAMDIYDQIAVKIIASQESIIGPVAIEQAEQVPGMHVDWPNHTVSISGDKVGSVKSLIETYKELFGQISVEVSKQAIAPLMNQLPEDSLRAALK